MERVEFVIPVKLLDVLRILASRENTLSFVIVVLLYSSSFLSAMFVLRTRTKYWDLGDYPANRKHMQNIKILDAGLWSLLLLRTESQGGILEDKEQPSSGKEEGEMDHVNRSILECAS